jgi:hypothetical protein
VTSSVDRQEAEIPWLGRPVAEVDPLQNSALKDRLLLFSAQKRDSRFSFHSYSN